MLRGRVMSKEQKKDRVVDLNTREIRYCAAAAQQKLQNCTDEQIEKRSCTSSNKKEKKKKKKTAGEIRAKACA